MGRLKNRKASGKDEVTGKMIKSRVYRMMDRIWKLCNMAFKSAVE